MKPFRIGDVEITTPVLLAPMAGVTDRPFRILCKEQGAGLVCTEMISAKAILYHNRKTYQLMNTAGEQGPVAVQLFGNEPEVMAEAAAQIEELPFDILDINMGCPVPKVVNNGEGSALMLDPKRAAAIVAAIVRRIRKPVTVKMRRGFDELRGNAVEMAKRLEAAGVAAVTVHGRTREQYYAGRADWNCIREVKEAVSVPVIGNGDVDSPETAQRMTAETGCDGVMIARAARGNPWVFGRPPGDLVDMILRHLDMLVAEKGEYVALREMRKHIAWYTAGLPNSASFRRQINAAEEICALQELVKSLPKSLVNIS